MTRSSEDRFAEALAHQLKNPAAAIQAAVENLRRNLCALLEEMPASRNGYGRSRPTLGHVLGRALDDHAAAPVTGLMPQDRLQLIAERLAAAGLDGDLQSAASRLARGGWDTFMDEIVPHLGDDPESSLDLLETVARLRANLAAMDAAAGRVRGLSAALRMLAGGAEGEQAEITASLRAAVQAARAILPQGVAIDLASPAVPAVRGRTELLREAWINLITNAVHAVGHRGRVHVEAVAEAGAHGGPRVLVRVTDDGPGIPADVMPRLFEPFFTTRAAEGGAGLGLALARRIIEASGGSLACTSRPGRTCFEAVLPVVVGKAGD